MIDFLENPDVIFILWIVAFSVTYWLISRD